MRHYSSGNGSSGSFPALGSLQVDTARIIQEQEGFIFVPSPYSTIHATMQSLFPSLILEMVTACAGESAAKRMPRSASLPSQSDFRHSPRSRTPIAATITILGSVVSSLNVDLPPDPSPNAQIGSDRTTSPLSYRHHVHGFPAF